MADFNAAWWRRIHRVMLVPSKTAIIRVKGETWLFDGRVCVSANMLTVDDLFTRCPDGWWQLRVESPPVPGAGDAEVVQQFHAALAQWQRMPGWQSLEVTSWSHASGGQAPARMLLHYGGQAVLVDSRVVDGITAAVGTDPVWWEGRPGNGPASAVRVITRRDNWQGLLGYVMPVLPDQQPSYPIVVPWASHQWNPHAPYATV